MRTATLKNRLYVWRPSADRSGFGDVEGELTPYNNGRWIYAERKRESGSGRNVVSERFSDYRAEYYIYNFHEVKEGWEVQDADTEIRYVVTNIFIDRPNSLRRIICERKNE